MPATPNASCSLARGEKPRRTAAATALRHLLTSAFAGHDFASARLPGSVDGCAICFESHHHILELDVDGKRSSSSSRVTEIFVWQNGRWTNPGWHTDPEK